MDIKRIAASPSAAERAAVDALLGPPQSAWDGGSRGDPLDLRVAAAGASRRDRLLPALQALQARVGWISEGGLGYVCDRLHVPRSDEPGGTDERG